MINRGTRSKYSSDINMTPLIDVMLVLLVVFMITAPMLVTGVDVDLPKTKNVKALKDSKKPLVISIDNNSNIFVGTLKINLNELEKKLKAMIDVNPDSEVLIVADKGLLYDFVLNIMGKVTNAGFEKVSLVAKAE